MDWLDEHDGYASDDSLLCDLYDFLEYLRVDEGSPFQDCETFDEILAVIEGMKARDQRVLSKYLVGFLDAKDVCANSKGTYYNKIKSLFQFNVYSILFPKNQKISWTPNRFDNRKFRKKPDQYEMTVDDFRTTMGHIKEPLWRSVFMSKFQMMVDTASLIQFNMNGWDRIKDQFLKGESVNGRRDRILVVMPPRSKIKKRGALPYPTSFERDAILEMRNYFDIERGVPEDGEPIWLTNRGEPITRRRVGDVWLEYVKKSGLVKPYRYKCPDCGQNLKKTRIRLPSGSQPQRYFCRRCQKIFKRREIPDALSKRELSRVRYGYGLHEACRDVTSSEVEIAIYRTGAPPWVSNLRMGNTSRVDPNGYQKCMQKNYACAEEIFDLISPWLNVLSEDPEKVSISEYNKMQHRYEKAIGEIREEIEYLKELVGERR